MTGERLGMGRPHPGLGPAAFLALAIGGACSAAWVLHASGPLVWHQAQAFNWWLAVPAAGLTLANLALRFVRWQFLLRRAGVRLPVRHSAGIFTAGLAMLLTPAYAGEGVKAWLVGRLRPGTLPRAAGAVVAERLLDGIALALAGGAALLIGGQAVLGIALCAAGGAGLVTLHALSRGAPAVRALVARLRGLGTASDPAAGPAFVVDVRGVGIALALSVPAWLAGCLTLYAVSAAAAIEIGPAEAVATYAVSTLLGGLTLLPAGAGVVGTAILVRLEGHGATLQQAVLAAVVVRLLTVWLTAVIGVAGCWRIWRRARPILDERPAAEHFGGLAPRYAEELSAAARERVVKRKVELMRRCLHTAGIAPGARLLDAGCGHGWYAAALARVGYEVTGIDLAPGQVTAARAHQRAADAGRERTAFAAASLFSPPFPTGSFDSAYAVNVLHHAGDRSDQDAALAALARVVRPGGLIFVHEINTVNLLFRLYMAYIFPLLKQIDVGTETWLDPRRPPRAAGLELQRIELYTFLPDFTPARLYRWLDRLERSLERSRWSLYSAHFTAVYLRVPDLTPSQGPAQGSRPATGPRGGTGPPGIPPPSGGPLGDGKGERRPPVAASRGRCAPTPRHERPGAAAAAGDGVPVPAGA